MIPPAGEYVADTETCPLTLSATFCGLFGALSLKTRVPVRLPDADGVAASVTVHIPPG